MKKNNRGFTLIEMLISAAILVIITSTMYFLIQTSQSIQLTEGRKLDMNQAARALEQFLYENIRSAGSILSVMNTKSFLATPPPFTGIYPLNNNNFPDGVILASADPKAVTSLTTNPFNPAAGTGTLDVATVDDPDNPSQSAWQAEDLGIIMRTEGYCIFKVTATPAAGSNQLAIRPTPVYYSGLLNTANYNDLTDDQNSDGNKTGQQYIYALGSPVVKLEFFNIFLVSEHAGVRTLTLTTDCGAGGAAVANVLGNPDVSQGRAIPIVPNLEDLQLEYITKDNPAEFWASLSTQGTSYANPCAASGSTDCLSFIEQFQTKNIASVRIYVLLKTEEETEKSKGSGIVFHKPIMGDIAAATLPVSRFHYNYMEYEVFVRNYSIVY